MHSVSDSPVTLRQLVRLAAGASGSSEHSCGDDPSRDPAPSRSPTNAEQQLANGLRALEEFDYDAARTHLEEAVDSSGGALAPARALLDLLVNILAADRDAVRALAAWPGIPEARVACVARDADDDEQIQLIAVDAAGRVHEGPVLDDAWEDSVLAFMPDHTTRTIHFVYDRGDDGTRIRVLPPCGHLFRRDWITHPAGGASACCQREVHASRHDVSDVVRAQGRGTRDETPNAVARPRLVSSDLMDLSRCGGADACAPEMQKSVDSIFRGATTREEIAAKARSFLHGADSRSPQLSGLVLHRASGCIAEGRLDLADARRAFEQHPMDAFLANCFAECAIAAGAWDEVERVLGAVDEAGIAGLVVSHTLHLRGIAALRRGEIAGARAMLMRAATFEPGCKVEVLRALVGDPEAPPTDYTTLREAILAADECLARGDRRGARELLDVSLVASCGERQALARRAALWLEVPASDPGSLGKKIVACSRFRHAMTESVLLQTDLPIGAGQWDRSRLDELAERVHVWLLAETAEGRSLGRA